MDDKARILIVDDTPANIKILSELFKLKGKFSGALREYETKKELSLKQNAEALAKIRILAKKTAFPGVTIAIVDKHITLNAPKQASRFHWHAEKGGIAVTGL
jgi:CheY-like chemotaxis protein